MTDSNRKTATREELEDMVAEADTGGRKPTGVSKAVVFSIAICWALFQLWYASPLPYYLNIGIITDGQARIIHLSFAFLLRLHRFPGAEIVAARLHPPL